MIKSFACKETEAIFNRTPSRRLPPDIQRAALIRLIYLDNAKSLQDLMVPPANRLEALKGNRKGQHSIRINKQWRICFAWQEGDVYNVEITDYH